MFFHLALEKNVHLPPQYLNRNYQQNIFSQLKKNVEGSFSAKHGVVVAITGIDSIGKGLVRSDGSGHVTFTVKYHCVVLRLFKGEILEAVVTKVNKMGFFAEVGPTEIFVSEHAMPESMKFHAGDMPNYADDNKSIKIQMDSELRIKIIGIRIDADVMFGIGSIKDHFLGVINDPALDAIGMRDTGVLMD